MTTSVSCKYCSGIFNISVGDEIVMDGEEGEEWFVCYRCYQKLKERAGS